MPPPLDHEVSDFEGRHALTNSLIVGTYLKLVAQGESQVAQAWLDCAVTFEPAVMELRAQGAYSRTARPVLRMTVLPMSERSHATLGAAIDLVRSTVRLFSSETEHDLDLDAVVWVEIGPVVRPSTEERVVDIRTALEACGDEGVDLAAELDDLLPGMLLGWSAYASQRVQHFAVLDGDERTVARVSAILKSLNDFLWSHDHVRLTTGEMNNISFASTAPGPQLLQDAAGLRSLARKKWRVGVIVPGGEAARSDIEDIELHPDVECDLRRVYRGADRFPVQMSNALTAFKSDRDAILIAYGGGGAADIAKVHAALNPHLEALDVPCWVAVGHASDDMVVANPLVRVCRTPSDARTLFLAETVEYERQVGAILAEAVRGLEHGGRTVGIGAGVEHRLAELANKVLTARSLHLQGGSH